MNIHFVEEDIQMPNRQNKRYPTMLLIIWKMQIEITGRYYLTHIKNGYYQIDNKENL